MTLLSFLGNVTIAKDMLVAVDSVNDDPLRQLITDAWMKDDNVTLDRAQHFSQVITEDFITDVSFLHHRRYICLVDIGLFLLIFFFCRGL